MDVTAAAKSGLFSCPQIRVLVALSVTVMFASDSVAQVRYYGLSPSIGSIRDFKDCAAFGKEWARFLKPIKDDFSQCLHEHANGQYSDYFVKQDECNAIERTLHDLYNRESKEMDQCRKIAYEQIERKRRSIAADEERKRRSIAEDEERKAKEEQRKADRERDEAKQQEFFDSIDKIYEDRIRRQEQARPSKAIVKPRSDKNDGRQAVLREDFGKSSPERIEITPKNIDILTYRSVNTLRNGVKTNFGISKSQWVNLPKNAREIGSALRRMGLRFESSGGVHNRSDLDFLFKTTRTLNQFRTHRLSIKTTRAALYHFEEIVEDAIADLDRAVAEFDQLSTDGTAGQNGGKCIEINGEIACSK